MEFSPSRRRRSDRRDLQFSIARLLVAMTLLAMLLALRPSPTTLLAAWPLIAVIVLLVLFTDWSLWHVGEADYALRYGDCETAVRKYTKAIEARPNDPQRYCLRAVAHQRRGDFQAAGSDYQQAIQLDPRYAPAWFGRATVSLHHGEFQRAADEATVALCYDAGDVLALTIRGYTLCLLEQEAAGMSDLDQAAQLAPEDQQVFQFRGWARLTAGDHQAALADFQRCWSLQESSSSQVGRALVLYACGQYRQALRVGEECLRLWPDDSGAVLAMAWFLATCPIDSLRDGRRALRLARLAERHESLTSCQADSCLAAAEAEVGRFPEAAELGRIALEAAPPAWRNELRQALAAYQLQRPFRAVVAGTPSGAADAEDS